MQLERRRPVHESHGSPTLLTPFDHIGRANGRGAFTHIGDAGEMLKHGSAPWHLWLFAALTVPAGLSLWHNLGPDFGLGKPPGAVDRRVAYATLACALALIALGFAVGR
jgi:hypothetical protein